MKRSTIKNFVRWALVTLLVFLAFWVAARVFKFFGHPMGQDTYDTILGIEIGALAVLGTIFNVNNKCSFSERIKKFFSEWLVILLCIVLFATLFFLIISGDRVATEQTPDSPGQEASDGTGQSPSDEENKGAQPSEPAAPYLSLAEWEEDSFFLHLDQYCGYHVENEEMEQMIFSLLSTCQSEIEVRGHYPDDTLNAGEYATHATRANQLRSVHDFMKSEEILPDKQIAFLEEEIEERKLADDLYRVSDNEAIIGNNYLKLGNIAQKSGDTAKAHKHYAQAFEWFQTSYRTAVAEGETADTLKSFINQMINAKDKLLNLDGIDSPERTMAPKVTNVLERLLEVD